MTESNSRPAVPGSAASQVITPARAAFVDLGSLGVRFLATAHQTGGTLSVVEHPVPARTLAAPRHRHRNEDEYSYVIEGVMGAVLGDEVVQAGAGSLVFKPRGQWHTFWNAGDGICRILEIIAPAGFEQLFADIAADPEAMTGERATALDARYGLDVDYESIGRLCQEHGLSFPA
jgi:mannose-6-phosphate isomerase-like protein (cupin superfamily)